MTKDKLDKQKPSPPDKKGKDISTRFPKKEWAEKLGTPIQKPERRPQFLAQVYILIDCSISMSGGNKMDQAKKGAVGFAKEAYQKGYAVGLISFGLGAEHILPPQTHTGTLFDCIELLEADGSTPMTEALETAVYELGPTTKGGEKVICVVTDGMPDNKETALAIGRDARLMNIDILAIGTDDADMQFLKELATQENLSRKVAREHFEEGISAMAKMLPQGKKSLDTE